MTLLVAALSAFRPWEFPPDTLPYQVRRGVGTYVAGQGLDRIWDEDQVSIGSWSPGLGRVDVESAIWLSPNLLSRWLGYLEAKEKWPDGEREARWDTLRAELNGKAVLIVRLCAFPKKGGFFADDEPADMSALRPLRWTVTLNGSTIPVSRPTNLLDRSPSYWTPTQGEWPKLEPASWVMPIGRKRSDSYKNLLRTSWVQWTPLASTLAPEFETEEPGFRTSFGEYTAEWFWVEADFRNGMRPTEQFELRIFSRRRERIASFPIHFSPLLGKTSPKAMEKGKSR